VVQARSTCLKAQGVRRRSRLNTAHKCGSSANPSSATTSLFDHPCALSSSASWTLTLQANCLGDRPSALADRRSRWRTVTPRYAATQAALNPARQKQAFHCRTVAEPVLSARQSALR